MNGEESDRSCSSVKKQQPSPRSRSPRSTQAFLANQTLEIHRRMPPLLLPTLPSPAMVAESNGAISDVGVTVKVEAGKGGAGSERGSPIEKYMRPSKPSSYSPPGSPIEKYQYPLFSLPLPLTISPDLTPESDWLRFWTKYKMAATSGVPGSLSNLCSPGGLGNNSHHLSTLVTPVQYHQQSYTVPYCASPYSPLPLPPAPTNYALPPPTQNSSTASSESDAPLDLAVRQRDTSAASVSTNGAERSRLESPPTERLTGGLKEEKEDQEITNEGSLCEKDDGIKLPSSPLSNCTKVDAATQSDLTNRCVHCGIYFLDEVMYALHMSCHGDKAPYQCGFCLHTCADRYDFTTHIQRGLHRYADKTSPQKGHTRDRESPNVTSAPECRNVTDGERDGEVTGEVTGDGDEVGATCNREKENPGSGADDIKTGAEKEGRGGNKDLGGKTVSDISDGISKTTEILTVVESELDGLTDKN